VLGSLGNALQRLSAESLSTVRAAAVPVLQVTNQTALDARSVLQDLGGDVAMAAVRARASGWDAAHCAQGKVTVCTEPALVMKPCPYTDCLPNRQAEAGRTAAAGGTGQAGRLHGSGRGRSGGSRRRHRQLDPGSSASHRQGGA
jgi:hypothetical protein